MADQPPPAVDPREFVRSMLHIAPDDAEKVREATPGTRKSKVSPGENDDADDDPRGRFEPTATYGEE